MSEMGKEVLGMGKVMKLNYNMSVSNGLNIRVGIKNKQLSDL